MTTITRPCPRCHGWGTEVWEDEEGHTREDICPRCGGDETIEDET